MLGKALRIEYERSLQKRLARDSRGRVYLLTLDSDRRGKPSLRLRRSRGPEPRSLAEFSRPAAVGAPRPPEGDDLFVAGMVIDCRDRMHVVENTQAGLSRYWTADLNAVERLSDIGRSAAMVNPRSGGQGVSVIENKGSRLGDIAVAPDGAVWLAWIVTDSDHLTAVHLGNGRDRRWRSWKLVEADGACPPSLLICSDGTFCLAWHDIREDLYCLDGNLADVGRRKQWKARKVTDRARRPAMAELDGRRVAVFENDGAFLDGIALDEPSAERSFVTWPDERFIGHTTHSPQFSTDRYGIPWLFFIDSTRRCIFCARWLGAGWGPIQRGPAMIRNSPRFEDNHLALDRFAVETRQGEDVGGMALAITHDGPPPSTRLSRVEVPSLKADAGVKVLFLDLKEIQVMDGLRLRLNAARKSPANPILRRNGRGMDANGVCFPRLLKEQGVYRLWYAGIRVNMEKSWRDWYTIGYAESSDGIRFAGRRGKLNGSESATGRLPHSPLPYGCQIFHDKEEPNPDRRYKMIGFADSGKHLEDLRQALTDPWSDMAQGWLHTSPDGLQWRRHRTWLRFPAGRPFSFVPQCMFRDVLEKDPARRFKAYGFTSLNMGRRGGAYAYSPDAVQWTYCEDNPVLDPFARCVPVVRGGKRQQIHDMVVWQHAGYYLALYQYQYESGMHDVELAVSRDGEHFADVCPGEKVLSLGSPKSWDSAEITPAVPLLDADRISLYYGGIGRHVTNIDETGSDLDEANIPRGIGLATLRPDGFSHIEPDRNRNHGVLTTIPVSPGSARTLRVNAACRRGAAIKVEIVGAESGQALSGYGRSDAHPIRGDQTDGLVKWKEKATLPLQDKPFAIRFHLQGAHARLYSFSFT